MNIYTTQLRLRNKDVNLHRRLRSSVLFELLQEASIRHTEELGMGREMTLDRGLLWMVTLQRAEIARMPAYDECVTLESWPGETMHLLFPRYYRVLGENGETLLSASAPRPSAVARALMSDLMMRAASSLDCSSKRGETVSLRRASSMLFTAMPVAKI